MDLADLIQKVTVFALPVLFAITAHEAAHGYAARHFGDPTAWQLGRLTLNPVPHIDPVGTVLMPLLLYFATAGAFLFGYAKPVPVNVGRLRRPRQHMVWVALAGPSCNFAQALLWALAFTALQAAGMQERFFIDMAKAGILVNLVMWAFNLFPLPPLDGGRILAGLVPPRAALLLARIEPYGFFIVLALVIAGIVSQWWLQPLLKLGYLIVNTAMHPVRALLS